MHQRIHICPVSPDIDRIVLPLVRMKADRAILVTERAPPEGARATLDPVTARLDAEHVAWETLACDPGDFLDCLRTLSPAVRRAAADGDHVLANVSTGELLLPLAVAVAGMLWGAELYYVIPSAEGTPPDGPGGVVAVPRYRIERPSEGAVACLRALARHGDMLPRRALIGALRLDGVTLARSECPRALYVALERLVGPLLERGWVAERAVGGVKLVLITEEGRGVPCGFDMQVT
jgi:hypothetical protein